MGVVPLVRAEPSQDKHGEADDEVRSQHVDPDLEGQRGQEREETRVFLFGFLEDDADAKVHEGLGEVNELFPDPGDGQRGHGQVCFLKEIRFTGPKSMSISVSARGCAVHISTY